MRQILIISLMVLLASCSCTRSKKDKKECVGKTAKGVYNEYKNVYSDDLAFPYWNDSVLVLYGTAARSLLVIHKNEVGQCDTTIINDVGNILEYRHFKNGLFGIEMDVLCGNNCESREFYLFKPIGSCFRAVLILKSYQSETNLKECDQPPLGSKFCISFTEHIEHVINASNDGTNLFIIEKQSCKSFNDTAIREKFSKSFEVKWDSVNMVFCNDYIDLKDNYTLFPADNYQEYSEMIDASKIPCFRSEKYTYIFLRGKWAILDTKRKEIRFLL